MFLANTVSPPAKEVRNDENTLNMTYLALNLSGYVNGVTKKHGEVSRLMFAGYAIDAITNGSARCHLDRAFLPATLRSLHSGLARDNSSLRYALSIPKKEIWDAHLQEKQHLIRHVNNVANVALDPSVLTIGFARRVTSYIARRSPFRRSGTPASDCCQNRAFSCWSMPARLILMTNPARN